MPNLPSTNLSFDLINDELGNNSTDTLDLQTASNELGATGAPYGMDELIGLSGAGTRPNFTTDLTAVNTGISGEGKVQTDWVVDLDPTGTQGGESFALKRSTNSDMSIPLLISTNNDNSELETGLIAGVLYYFQATGTNDAGSTNSSIVSARATKLPSITSFSVTTGTGGLGLIDINWSIDNGYPNSLTSFTLEQSLNSDMSSATEATPTNDGSHQYNQSVFAGTRIYFRITATNSVGTTVSTIKSAIASSKPTINSFTGARSETVAGRVDLNWSTTAGTAATSAFSITRGTTLANAIGGTSVATVNDGTQEVTGIGTGVSNFYYMTITNANGTSALYANSATAITTRPAPTIDTFNAVTGDVEGEIDISWTTTEADTITLYRDNGAGGAVNTVVNGLSNSTSVDSNTTETGLQTNPTLTYNFQLVADGVGSEQAADTDTAEPFAAPSFNHQGVTTHALSGTNGKFNDQDTLTSNAAGAGGTPTTISNRNGSVSITVNGNANGEDVQVSYSQFELSGYSSYSDSHTGINLNTIYYRVKWTETDPAPIGAPQSSRADGDSPINSSTTITFSNGGVSSNVGVSVNFYNTIGTNPTGSGAGPGGLCIYENIPVNVPNGTSNINTLQVGDMVKSWNFETKAIEEVPILDIIKPIHNNLIKVSLEDPNKEDWLNEIILTTDHPIYKQDGTLVSGTPDLSKSRYNVETNTLKVNDYISMLDGKYYARVSKIEDFEGEHNTYTILTKNNNFYAGGILVHSEIEKK